ncbi:sensor domain-containing diguanylate cyclase [uncultured Erythrobacter sp.]|uniref:GGDEF domain-containing protein n=1 Tax=uncultured Erythrobacter sp. TaxID=263913 RepID=UPI0026131953|nr:sensor domain-containing diguanylate cyclase [uncultured Erythrobacter sp.]
MKIDFSNAEGRVLHGLIEDAAGDIVVRLDSAGFIVHASANASQLGIDLSSLLLMPHISDFADPDHTADLVRYVTQVLSGGVSHGWIEFPVCKSAAPEEERADNEFAEPRWYAFSLRLIDDDDGVPQGALGLLRSVQQKHSLEGEISARALTDPLTGLANRHAFCADLRCAIAGEGEHTMAVLAVDRMRAIFMQYGQRTADEIQWGFAKYLESMVLPGHTLAQIDSERFGVLLRGMNTAQARGWAGDTLRTFAGLAGSSSSRTPELSASAGLARAEMNVDWTLRQAELGLVMARAGGGMRVSVCAQSPSGDAGVLAKSDEIERAIDAAVSRAEQRRA